MKGPIILRIWEKTRDFASRYPVIIAALLIYLYYLLASVDLFHHKEKQSFLDYVMRFGSLFFLWLAAAAVIQMQKLKKSMKEEEERRREIERVLDHQQIYNTLMKDITMLLQDNVNNPLAIIGMTTQEIRRRFETDPEIIRWLDRIDGAMKRIHNTIRDLQSYEAQKLIETSRDILGGSNPPGEKK